MYTLLKLLVFSDLVLIFQILLCQEFGSAFTKRYLKELLDEPVEVKAKYISTEDGKAQRKCPYDIWMA
jgi:hypothetical protein